MSNNIDSRWNDVTGHENLPPKQGAAIYQPPRGEHEHSTCAHVPEFKRLNYFYGQMLGAQDFQAEQHFFREKMKLHNRCLHGYGVVCGLRVIPDPQPIPCEPLSDAELKRFHQELKYVEDKIAEAKAKPDSKEVQDELKKLYADREYWVRRIEDLNKEHCEGEVLTSIEVECGLALDCDGNEIVVRRPLKVDLWKALSRDDRLDLQNPPPAQPTPVSGEGPNLDHLKDGHSLYVSICYCEQPVDPVRPVLPDTCGAGQECVYGKLRDAVHIVVSTKRPDDDERCETCCAPCREHEVDSCEAEPAPCVLLARIDNFKRGRPVAPGDIYNEVRRPVSLYVPTTITGISWAHGAVYTRAQASTVLDLMEIRFSRPVLVSTISQGIIDMWVVEGGETRGAGIYSLEVEYVDLPAPPQKFTQAIKFRYTGDEDLDPGDRVQIVIRAGFIMDKCCRPVDGTNTGGRTPLINEEPYSKIDKARTDQRRRIEECVWPPPGFGPWYSGAGAAGGNFESWFSVPVEKGGNFGGYRKARTAEESQ
jgi:hypothetical protein